MEQMNLNFSEISPTEELITMLLNGDILTQLEKDFPNIQLQELDEYLGYIEEYFKDYANNTFALYKGYRFDLVCTGILATESLINKMYSHLKLNDCLGFRLVNTKLGQIEKVETYNDIVHMLNGK